MKLRKESVRRSGMRIGLMIAALVIIMGASASLGALTSKIILNVSATFTGGTGLGTATETMNLDYSINFTNGTGANQANIIYSASRSLVDDANDTLNLYDSGTLKDTFGNDLTIDKLKLLILYNTSTTARLKIGGGETPVGLFADAGDIQLLQPGGKFMFSAPDANGVDLMTNKNLRLEHDGGGTSSLVYKIIVLGVD